MIWREPVLYKMDETLPGGGAHLFLTPPVERGDVWYIEEVSVYVSTSTTADVKIGVRTGADYTWFESLLNLGADTYTLAHLRFTLTTNQRLAIHFMNCGQGERIKAAVNGYILVPIKPEY
jgi:hypothetical protein